MPTINLRPRYGTIITPTITLSGLASSATAGQKSSAVDWSAQAITGAQVEVTCVVGSGTIANDRCAYVYIARSIDGTNYDDALAAGDGAVTPASPSNMLYIGSVSIPAQSTTYIKIFNVSNLPPSFVIVVRNYSGIALAAGSSVRILPVGEQFVNA